MIWQIWVLTALEVIAIIGTVIGVGKEHEPLTARMAAVAVSMNLVDIALLLSIGAEV